MRLTTEEKTETLLALATIRGERNQVSKAMMLTEIHEHPDRCPSEGCTSRRLDLKPDLSKFIDGSAGGMKKGVRDMVLSINQIVKSLTTDEAPADEATVIKTLISLGFEEETVIKRIQALLNEGKLMSPRDGQLRAVY